MRKSRMFEGLKTWNPWFGCKHDCYGRGCWARKKLAHRLGRMLNCEKCYNFEPHLHMERLERIPPDSSIFVVAHGDLFGKWVPSHVIRGILGLCRSKPKKCWFFETKNPERYKEFLGLFPKNSVLSTTIETNRIYPTEVRGFTPRPEERFKAIMHMSSFYSIHVSIEPILDFDLEVLESWMKQLKPVKIAVGYDSLGNNLPEPTGDKTMELIDRLERFTDVERKQL